MSGSSQFEVREQWRNLTAERRRSGKLMPSLSVGGSSSCKDRSEFWQQLALCMTNAAAPAEPLFDSLARVACLLCRISSVNDVCVSAFVALAPSGDFVAT